MPTNSSYAYNGLSNGLGQLMISPSARTIYDRRRDHQPTLLPVRESGRSTIDSGSPIRTIQPIVTTSVPTTGGSYPILHPQPSSGNQPPKETTSSTSFLTLNGDHVVIAGDYHIKKKQAVMLGAGLAGTALLLK